MFQMMTGRDTLVPLHLAVLKDCTHTEQVLEIPPLLLAIASIDNIVADTALSKNLPMLPIQADTGHLLPCMQTMLQAHLALCRQLLEAQTHTGYQVCLIMSQYLTDICELDEDPMQNMSIVERIVVATLMAMDHTITGVLILYQMDRVCQNRTVRRVCTTLSVIHSMKYSNYLL